MEERPCLGPTAARDHRTASERMERGVTLVVGVPDYVSRYCQCHRHANARACAMGRASNGMSLARPRPGPQTLLGGDGQEKGKKKASDGRHDGRNPDGFNGPRGQ